MFLLRSRHSRHLRTAHAPAAGLGRIVQVTRDGGVSARPSSRGRAGSQPGSPKTLVLAARIGRKDDELAGPSRPFAEQGSNLRTSSLLMESVSGVRFCQRGHFTAMELCPQIIPSHFWAGRGTLRGQESLEKAETVGVAVIDPQRFPCGLVSAVLAAVSSPWWRAPSRQTR